jgi:hypothetical protein
MGRVSVPAKLASIKGKLKQLASLGKGCTYCQGNCYELIAPYLDSLRQWLEQSKDLHSTVLDRELLWIFGKKGKLAPDANNVNCTHNSAEDSSDSDSSSQDSFESVHTQGSDLPTKRKRIGNPLISSPADVFLSDSTIDSDADGLELFAGGHETAPASACSSHVHHESAKKVPYLELQQ